MAEQIAELLECKTEAAQKSGLISDDIEFLKHKGFQNEAEIFKLKRQTSVR